MKFLKVPRKIAEKTRKELIERGILSKKHEIVPREEFVLLPVIKGYGDFEIVEME
ncbi:MAG: tRNA (guanine-N1)-methyltransferase, partial [Candidatus Micrarchaeota archaeon]